MGAVEYAENELGVHKVYKDLEEARGDLDATYSQLAETKDKKRLLEQQISDREMEIVIDERSKHTDMSVTAMEKHLKVAFFQDEKWKSLRDELRETNNELDAEEYDKAIREKDIKIMCARLEELGGYLNYLAAVKNAATLAKAATPSTATP